MSISFIFLILFVMHSSCMETEATDSIRKFEIVEIKNIPRKLGGSPVSWSEDGKFVYYSSCGIILKIPDENGSKDSVNSENSNCRSIILHPNEQYKDKVLEKKVLVTSIKFVETFLKRRLEFDSSLSINWSHDGQFIFASISEAKVDISCLADVRDRDNIKYSKIAYFKVFDQSCSSDSNYFVTKIKDKGTIFLWDFSEKNEARVTYELYKDDDEINCISWSPDSNYLLVSRFLDHEEVAIDLWDLRDKKNIKKLGVKYLLGKINQISWGPNMKYAVCISGSTYILLKFD